MMSKICLGTAQFGLSYGVNNNGKKLTSSDVYTILDYASTHGITYLDTAKGYGNSEELIGNYIRKNPNHTFKVISKVALEQASSSHNTIPDKIVSIIEESLQILHLNTLHGCLLHSAKEYYIPEIIMGLIKAKEKGLVHKIGVSVYDMEDALTVVSNPQMDMIQIMYNAFDQRADQLRLWKQANQNSIHIFARSIFLQGLLLMNPGTLPPYLLHAKPYLQTFLQIIKEENFSQLEAAYLFAYSQKNIDHLVLGIDSIDQLALNLTLHKRIEEFTTCRNKIIKDLANVEKHVIYPSLWKQS